MKTSKTNLHLKITVPVAGIFLASSLLTAGQLPPFLGMVVIASGLLASLFFCTYICRIERHLEETDRKQRTEIANRRFAEAQTTEAKERAEAGASAHELASASQHKISGSQAILDTYNPTSYDSAKAAQLKRKKHLEKENKTGAKM